MKILVTSDIHASPNCIEILKSIKNVNCILNCGDLQSYFDSVIPHYFIHGNHENFDLIETMDKGYLKFNNLKHIKNGERINICNDKLSQSNITVLGFGGNYSPSRYTHRKDYLKGDRRRHFVEDEFKEACKHKCDILLTHEAPLGLLSKSGRDVGQPLINKLIKRVKPIISFSGHHHTYKVNKLDNTILVSVPRITEGYILLDTETWKFSLVK